MRQLKLIGWFIKDHWIFLAGLVIGTILFVFVISPAVNALLKAIAGAFE